MQLGAALSDYSYYCRQKNLTAPTLRWYEHKLRFFAEWCAREGKITAVEEIRPATIYRFTDYLKTAPGFDDHRGKGTGERSAQTIRGYMQVVKGFLAWAEKEELIGKAVSTRLEMPKVEKKVIRTLSREQYNALMVCASNEFLSWIAHRDRAILSTLIDTGIRASELCSLTMDRVHLGGGEAYLTVKGKGRKEREVGPLGAESERLLRRYLRFRPNTEHTEVFLSRHHLPLTVSGLDQLLYRLERWAGPERFKGIRLSAHTFRHTYAVNFLRAGGDVHNLSLLLGHSSLVVTQTYVADYKQKEARRGSSVLDAWK